VGNAQNYQASDWLNDITLAKAAHLDGFALNIASQDGNTQTLLQAAYDAAASAGGFSMFISFDYLSEGPWSAGEVTNLINQFKTSPAQFTYNGAPLVSTFEGVDNAGDWPGIKASTGCYFVPSWTSMGPSFASHLNEVDGFFSWDMWPEGATDKDSSSDLMWINMLQGKTYMMGISPWFYTNLPQWNKNWLWRGDDLWFLRWQQAIALQPALVEVFASLFSF
jgi:aminopeptidase I